jgi:molybdopterin synthase sulfur carrier subunit
MITVVFLGKLADVAGSSQREVAAAETLDQLVDTFEPPLRDVIENGLSDDSVRVGIDGRIGRARLTDGCEIAFLPPVSGG